MEPRRYIEEAKDNTNVRESGRISHFEKLS